jgi:regulator of replication initiation timing
VFCSDLQRQKETAVEEMSANLKAVVTELDIVKAELRDLTEKNRDLTEENRDLAAYVDAKV